MVIQGSTRGTLDSRRWFLQLHGSVMLWSYHAIRWELNASKFESNPVMEWSKAFWLLLESLLKNSVKMISSIIPVMSIWYKNHISIWLAKWKSSIFSRRDRQRTCVYSKNYLFKKCHALYWKRSATDDRNLEQRDVRVRVELFHDPLSLCFCIHGWINLN